MNVKHNLLSLVIGVLLGATGTAVYCGLAKNPVANPVHTEKQAAPALTVERLENNESLVTVDDAYAPGSAFSLRFPQSWGFVNVKRQDLTDSDTDRPKPQIAGYTFTSGFRPYSHSFTVYISHEAKKEDSLVTQGGRIEIGTLGAYFYNYLPNAEPSDNTVKAAEVAAEVETIVSTFAAAK